MAARIASLALLALVGIAPNTAIAETTEPALVVYAAGSATGVLGAMLKRFEVETGQRVDLQTGPAGLMRKRIEAGERADLFVSANMAHPQSLHAQGKASAVAIFARNRLCVYALPAVGMTSANVLDRLLDPKVRIGTSTPGADPGGDYAQEMFGKADHIRPGATSMLKAKAKAVVGATVNPAPSKAATQAEAMLERGTDVSVGYCSSRKTAPDPSVDKVELPPELAVKADYGMVLVTTAHDPAREAAAGKLALYLLSPESQSLLAAYGFGAR
ncbi:molybdate ABC transporter substrate-binding protein [Novosphingobium gossypii]|uniref:molybdate ABC transporter substrate-binding protein n=1 Tax=Novosphingobium gossypii TaxID=1604774 RepID=UPI003D1D550C